MDYCELPRRIRYEAWLAEEEAVPVAREQGACAFLISLTGRPDRVF